MSFIASWKLRMQDIQNHSHVLLRHDPPELNSWSKAETASDAERKVIFFIMKYYVFRNCSTLLYRPNLLYTPWPCTTLPCSSSVQGCVPLTRSDTATASLNIQSPLRHGVSFSLSRPNLYLHHFCTNFNSWTSEDFSSLAHRAKGSGISLNRGNISRQNFLPSLEPCGSVDLLCKLWTLWYTSVVTIWISIHEQGFC